MPDTGALIPTPLMPETTLPVSVPVTSPRREALVLALVLRMVDRSVISATEWLWELLALPKSPAVRVVASALVASAVERPST